MSELTHTTTIKKEESSSAQYDEFCICDYFVKNYHTEPERECLSRKRKLKPIFEQIFVDLKFNALFDIAMDDINYENAIKNCCDAVEKEINTRTELIKDKIKSDGKEVFGNLKISSTEIEEQVRLFAYKKLENDFHVSVQKFTKILGDISDLCHEKKLHEKDKRIENHDTTTYTYTSFNNLVSIIVKSEIYSLANSYWVGNCSGKCSGKCTGNISVSTTKFKFEKVSNVVIYYCDASWNKIKESEPETKSKNQRGKKIDLLLDPNLSRICYKINDNYYSNKYAYDASRNSKMIPHDVLYYATHIYTYKRDESKKLESLKENGSGYIAQTTRIPDIKSYESIRDKLEVLKVPQKIHTHTIFNELINELEKIIPLIKKEYDELLVIDRTETEVEK